jgi:hypothetical protein
MISVGVCLRPPPLPGPEEQLGGPVIRGVFNGLENSPLLTQKELKTLDEILEVDGRDVRGLACDKVMLLLTDAPGTRSILKVRREQSIVTVEIKRHSTLHNSSPCKALSLSLPHSLWRYGMHLHKCKKKCEC